MRIIYLLNVIVVALALSGCPGPDNKEVKDKDIAALEGMAAKILKIDLAKLEKSGKERNMVGIRSKDVLFSHRLDSRTYFIQDDRFQVDGGSGVFQGSEEELIDLVHKVIANLEIPADEFEKSTVMNEKLQTAKFDEASKKYQPGEISQGKRFVEITRSVQGIPVFSSRILVGLTKDKSVGMLEAHWPKISEKVLADSKRLQELTKNDWKPPVQKGSVIESVEAGIIHSPAIGFVMDVYPVIRVIYAAENKSVGRKAVLYLDANGKRVPVPRTFEKIDEKPAGIRKGN